MELKFNGKINAVGQAVGDWNLEVRMDPEEFNLQVVKAAENLPHVLDFIGSKIDAALAQQKERSEKRLQLDRDEFEHRKAQDEQDSYWKKRYEDLDKRYAELDQKKDHVEDLLNTARMKLVERGADLDDLDA